MLVKEEGFILAGRERMAWAPCAPCLEKRTEGLGIKAPSQTRCQEGMTMGHLGQRLGVLEAHVRTKKCHRWISVGRLI